MFGLVMPSQQVVTLLPLKEVKIFLPPLKCAKRVPQQSHLIFYQVSYQIPFLLIKFDSEA